MNKYYWYKLESHFGPGHQSTETRYFYSTSVLGRIDRKEIKIEEACSISHRYDTDTITRLRLVKTVPPEEINRLRTQAERSIRNANAMLVALNGLE